jgi:hypothetical protein
MARVEKTLAELVSAGTPVKVIMLDNISSLFNITTNEEEAWIEVQAWLVSLRSRGYTVVYFHHAGKGGLSRGHSKGEDMLDISIQLESPDDPIAGQLHAIWTVDKDRAGFLTTRQMEIQAHRLHSPACQCDGKMMLTKCEGDGIRWEWAPVRNPKAEAEAMFQEGKSPKTVADALGESLGTVKTWRTKWGKKTGKEEG